MVICPNCGEDVREAKFCQNCGEPLPETAEEIPANVVKDSMFCKNCGKEVSSGANACPYCGFQFAVQETKFCQSCGEKINVNAEICPHCGVRVMAPTVTSEKNTAVAALLSFIFPGLGHLYLNLNTKGISFIIAYVVSMILVFILIGLILMIVVWLWAMIDVIKCTEAVNRGEYVEDKLF